MSRTEQRRLKLIAIGVEGDDIIDQVVEDDEKVDKAPKKKPKNDLAIKMSGIDRKDPKISFAELGFKVRISCFRHFFNFADFLIFLEFLNNFAIFRYLFLFHPFQILDIFRYFYSVIVM